MPRLADTTVYVTQDDGSVREYGPGSEVPAADAAKITNPKAWAEAPDDEKPSVPVKRPAKS